jgi:UDP-N-acetylmuramoylalanine--D-glutamate ligase
LPSSNLLRNLAGRRATVVGLGREGLDLARYLSAEGCRVRVTDLRSAEALREECASLADLPLEYSLGGHPVEPVLDADLLFVSPGVPPEMPVLLEARRRGLPLSSATELFFARSPARIIGITGSSGKSTTTALVGEMLRAAGQPVVVGGNIGNPLLGRLAELSADSVVVMELSSFQLESLDTSPWIAVITNITPNHLDRHPTMDDYVAAKERIIRFQQPSDWAVLNADDPISQRLQPPGQVARFSLERPVDGAFLAGDELRIALGERPRTICRLADLALRGRHNVANALTASLAATLAGAPIAALHQALAQFQGLPHRLECVGEIDGVRFFNDSIATAPERSMAGMAAFDEPLVLLAGGRDKHLPMADWAAMIRQRAAGVVLFGEAAPLIRAALERVEYPVERLRAADDMDQVVRLALDLAAPGTVVLLSPGGTSFDRYRDFTERGRVFARAVADLQRAERR